MISLVQHLPVAEMGGQQVSYQVETQLVVHLKPKIRILTVLACLSPFPQQPPSSEHLHSLELRQASFSEQHSQISRYTSPNSASPFFTSPTIWQLPQHPPVNSELRAHRTILIPSQANRKLKIMDVAPSTHHPPRHTRKIKLPAKRTTVIWMQLREHVASPRMVLLSSALARYRFGSQMRTIKTSAEAEMMREAFDKSGS